MRILFFANTPNVRTLRQAIALHHTGRHTLYLLYCNGLSVKRYLYRFISGLAEGKIYRNRRIDADLLRTLFRQIYTYRNFDELRRILPTIDADIIHAHAEPNEDVRVVLENVDIPVIYDPTDITSMRYEPGGNSSAEVEAEQYCFSYASGYVHKGPEIEYVRKTYGFDRPTLYFENYCVDEWIINNPSPKLSQQDGEYHLVFPGGIAPLFMSKKKVGYKQFGGLAEILGRQRIHLHLYISPFQSSSLVSYKREAAKNPFLHLHETLPPYQVSQEISRYDFGMWIHPRSSDSLLSDWTWNTSIGNKFYTYLEGGLPIIINDDLVYGANKIKELGIGIVVQYQMINELSHLLKETDIEILKSNVVRVRQGYLISQQIQRLEAFYEEICMAA